MKKTLALKLIALAFLGYVAIAPLPANAGCEGDTCVTFDDGSPGCADFNTNPYGPQVGCNVYTITINGDYHNFCWIESCN